MQHENLNHTQFKRLAFIYFSLKFFGQIARADLLQKFGTDLASHTLDLFLCIDLKPANAVLMNDNERYMRSDTFKTIFEHYSEYPLRMLAKGFGNSFSLQQAFIKNGHCWHVSAYDLKSKAFRDFVCTRFKRIELQETEPKIMNWPTLILLGIRFVNCSYYLIQGLSIIRPLK